MFGREKKITSRLKWIKCEFTPMLIILWYVLPSDHGSGRSCSENICEHNCTDLTDGGFLCSCRPGFKPRETDRNMCEGTGHSSSMLLVSVIVGRFILHFVQSSPLSLCPVVLSQYQNFDFDTISSLVSWFSIPNQYHQYKSVCHNYNWYILYRLRYCIWIYFQNRNCCFKLLHLDSSWINV